MPSLKESADKLLALPEDKQRELARIAIEHLKERMRGERRRAKKGMQRPQ